MMLNARSHGNGFLDFQPERVAIHCYRSTMAVYEYGDPSCWDDYWRQLVEECGVEVACNISGSLQYFVRCLRACCTTTLKCFPTSCRGVCADECLVITLLSAAQNSDYGIFEYCLLQLLQDDYALFADDLGKAARSAARELSSSSLKLMPIPLDVIQSIINSDCNRCKKCPRAIKN